jgi:CysZ protein
MNQLLRSFSLFAGITYPFKALKILFNNSRLWQYLILPILVNLIVGIILYITFLIPSQEFIEDLIMNFSDWLNQLIINLPSWLGIITYLIIAISWIVKIIVFLILFLIVGFIIVQFGCILGAPWYGKLSEELEKIQTGKVEIIEVNIFIDIWRAILFELKKLALLIVIGIPLILFNLIPTFGNLIFTIGGIILAGIIVCLDFFDAPLERRRLRFRQKLSIIRQTFPASAGFSLICLILISIPFLNLFIIPICVASGTLFICDRFLVNN